MLPTGGLPQALLQLVALPSGQYRIRFYGYGGGAQGKGEEKQLFFFSALETQGDLNQLLDRLFGSYE